MSETCRTLQCTYILRGMSLSNCMCPVEIYIYSGSIHHVEGNSHPSDQYKMNVRKHSSLSIHTYLDVCMFCVSLLPPPHRAFSCFLTFSSLPPPCFFSSFSLGTTMLLTVTLWLSLLLTTLQLYCPDLRAHGAPRVVWY